MSKRCFHIEFLLLAVLCGLSACVAEVDETLYTYAPVKTEFSLGLPQAGRPSGRMSADNVQASGANFEGISEMRLFPFEIATTEKKVAEGTTFSEFNVLNNLHQISRPHKDGTSIWYENVRVPVLTNTCLMYGVADHSQSALLGATPFSYGETRHSFDQVNIGKQVSVIKFTPALIQKKKTFIENLEPAIAWTRDQLNRVISAHTGDGSQPEMNWYQTTQKDLAKLYSDFVMQTTEGGVVSASSKSMLALYQNLYNELSKVKAAQTTADPQAADLAQAVMTAITTASAAGAKTFQMVASPVEPATTPATYTLAYKDADPNFPLCLDLPDGAVLLKVTSREGTKAVARYDYEDKLDVANAGPWDVYTYPATLYYTANTPVGTSNNLNRRILDEKITWEEFIAPDRYPFDYVSPLTKSIVLKQPVQYAMGNLVTSVKLASSQLNDSQRPAQVVDFTGGLLWTGLMVADQREVGWNFTREVTGLSERSYIVYDRELNGAALQLSSGSTGVLVMTEAQQTTPATNYTLVYPTKKIGGTVSATNTDRVHLVLEFENGPTAFHGAGGCLIAPFTRFYIPALLDLSKLPGGNSADRRQIFESDYNTKVTFRIDDLTNASNSVPDLRTVKTELGVSIVVEWERGFDFQVDVNTK